MSRNPCFFGEFKKLSRGEEMSKRVSNKRRVGLTSYDWMLSIDFDPGKYKMERKTADSLSEILSF